MIVLDVDDEQHGMPRIDNLIKGLIDHLAPDYFMSPPRVRCTALSWRKRGLRIAFDRAALLQQPTDPLAQPVHQRLHFTRAGDLAARAQAVNTSSIAPSCK
ncbi:MAG: hypothetical protein NTW37_21885 [Proteobacteria bacterium]|nr:hypothetical protein [Pseudomonadota bacterium]